MTENTKEYIVVKENTLCHKVGDVIKLNDKAAATLVNKVRPRDEVVGESKAGRKSKAEEENKVLKQRVSELEAQNKALHDENVSLKAPK
jgi:cell division protein FtsB